MVLNTTRPMTNKRRTWTNQNSHAETGEGATTLMVGGIVFACVVTPLENMQRNHRGLVSLQTRKPGTHWNDVAKSCQELDHDLLTLSTAAHSKTRDLEHTRGLPGREKEHLHKVNQAALDHIVAGLEAQSRGFNELHQEHEGHKKRLIDEAVKLRKRLVKGTK